MIASPDSPLLCAAPPLNASPTGAVARRVLRFCLAIAFGLTISACSKQELPPVPALHPYQPSAYLEDEAQKAAGVIKVAVPENKPPYFNGSTNDGIERDIIRESFKNSGKFVSFLGTAGRQKKYDSQRLGVECVSTVTPDLVLKSETHFSNPVVSYHYTPFTLKKNNIVINSFDDLAGKTIEAFSLAAIYLGPSFARLKDSEIALNYAEHENRSSQVSLLMSGRIQVLVIDRSMFHFILNNLRTTRPDSYDAEVAEVPLEIPVEFKLACHHQASIDQFNKGLTELHVSGGYRKIFAHYLNNSPTSKTKP